MKSRYSCILAIPLFYTIGLFASRSVRAQTTPSAMTIEEVLSRCADARGGLTKLQNVRTVHLRGTIVTGGLTGTFERWTTSNGQLRMAVDIADAFRQVQVFNGQRGWVLDASGSVHDLPDSTLKSVISSAYEATDSFLLSGRMNGRVELVGEDLSRGHTLRLEPEGGVSTTVHLDAKTFLPNSEETNGSAGKRAVAFSDWQDFAGIKFAGTLRQSNGDPRFDALITIQYVEVNGQFAAALFDKPTDSAPSVKFAGVGRQAVIPVVVYADHIFVPVRVNGAETGWFFFDSGAAASLVNKPSAEKDGLEFSGALEAKGVSNSTTVGWARNVTLNLPGVDLPTKTVAVVDLSGVLPVLGRPFDGLLGYDVISRVVVRVDYEHQQITLYDPATFVAHKGATALPITFVGNQPVVTVKILLNGRAPIETKCIIDSGAGGLMLAAPFANANHVLKSVRRTISSSVFSAGGISKEVAGRIRGLELGTFVLRNPVTTFSGDAKGILGDTEVGGLIGGEILKHFTVTFDYPHHQILLEPNGHFSDPFGANESGLSLIATGRDFHRFEADNVELGSPAAVAGLLSGDVITAIDGHAASELDLEKIDEIFQQNGRTIRLTITRGSKVSTASMKLKKRI